MKVFIDFPIEVLIHSIHINYAPLTTVGRRPRADKIVAVFSEHGLGIFARDYVGRQFKGIGIRYVDGDGTIVVYLPIKAPSEEVIVIGDDIFPSYDVVVLVEI